MINIYVICYFRLSKPVNMLTRASSEGPEPSLEDPLLSVESIRCDEGG